MAQSSGGPCKFEFAEDLNLYIMGAGGLRNNTTHTLTQGNAQRLIMTKRWSRVTLEIQIADSRLKNSKILG